MIFIYDCSNELSLRARIPMNQMNHVTTLQTKAIEVWQCLPLPKQQESLKTILSINVHDIYYLIVKIINVYGRNK